LPAASVALPPGSYSTPSTDSHVLALTVNSTGTITNAAFNDGGLFTFEGGTGDESSTGDITLTFNRLTVDGHVAQSGYGKWLADVTARFSNGDVESMAVTLNPAGN